MSHAAALSGCEMHLARAAAARARENNCVHGCAHGCVHCERSGAEPAANESANTTEVTALESVGGATAMTTFHGVLVMVLRVNRGEHAVKTVGVLLLDRPKTKVGFATLLVVSNHGVVASSGDCMVAKQMRSSNSWRELGGV